MAEELRDSKTMGLGDLQRETDLISRIQILTLVGQSSNIFLTDYNKDI